MYIPLSTSDGWPRGIYGSINLKKFMKPSFDQPKNISEDQTRNPNFFFLHQASGYRGPHPAPRYHLPTFVKHVLARLHTVMESDKICVLEKGRIVEEGSPKVSHGSFFSINQIFQ